MKRIFLFFSLFFSFLFFSCTDNENVRNQEVVKKKEIITPPHDNEGNSGGTNVTPPKKENAYLKVNAVGRSSFNGISIYVTDRYNISKIKSLGSSSSVSFDVSEYIGQKLYVRAIKDNNSISDKLTVAINKGDNFCSLPLKPEKVYDANIVVLKGGHPVSSQKVYAIPSWGFSALKPFIEQYIKNGISVDSLLKDYSSAITDSNGTARFKNLNDRLKEYVFLVVIKGEQYKTVSLFMDGTRKVGTIVLQEFGYLELKNKSYNPYSVNIFDSNKVEIQGFRMQGRKTKEIKLPIGNYTIKVKQISGYLVYPTEDAYDILVRSDKDTSLCFPSDRCN